MKRKEKEEEEKEEWREDEEILHRAGWSRRWSQKPIQR